ncbi:MAG TPA: hypothetical protein PK891_02610 [Bacteroidales bacterium]|nr:hypothetical protein [Bacteroidales bacterium]
MTIGIVDIHVLVLEVFSTPSRYTKTLFIFLSITPVKKCQVPSTVLALCDLGK